MTTTTQTVARPLAQVDEWATAQSGRARIRLHTNAGRGAYEVYALDGHELLPRTRTFSHLDDARAYANQLWGSL